MRKRLAYQIKSINWVGNGMHAQADIFTSLGDSKHYIDEIYTLFIPEILVQRVPKVGVFSQHREGKSKGLSAGFVQYCAKIAGMTTKQATGKADTGLRRATVAARELSR